MLQINLTEAEAHSQDARSEQEVLKSAVHSRYFELVEEGVSPNSAAANAIRAVGSGSKALPASGELPSSDDADNTALRRETQEDIGRMLSLDDADNTALRREPEEDTGRMRLSSSAPVLTSLQAGGGREPPQPSGHKNKDLWKTFGIHLPAGRLMKNLYGGAKLDPVPGTFKQSLPKRLGPPSELDTYMAVNNLKVGTAGLQYRKSKNIFDLCKGGEEFVRWGDSVEGHRVDAAWLQVGDRYLPTMVNNIQMLKRWQGPKVLRAEGLRRQQSLPSLRKGPKEKFNPKLSVGGVAYGF